MSTIKFLQADTSKLYLDDSSGKVLIELLWGDRIEVVNSTPVKGRVKVKARGHSGYVKESELGDKPLLEIYFIDVGQGDGILIITPGSDAERKHILIDGGYNRKAQPHGKSAADFVDWKFFKDYGEKKIRLDALISSHCDADHYGGLWDIVNPLETADLDCTEGVEIGQFYHAGVSWWKKGDGGKYVGPASNGYLTDLLEDTQSAKDALKPGAQPELAGNWAKFIECLVNRKVDISRLSYNPAKGFDYLPGFEKGKNVEIKVLGPIESQINGNPVLKNFGNDSKNTNGNSVVLRVDYGRSRILLAGDLNKISEQYILEVLKGNRLELSADVAKSCHHGSDDCSYDYLDSIHASASVISSGDDETHSHPRPNIVAACGITGYKKIENDELITPLIFSTEISRSVKIGDPYEVDYTGYSYKNANINLKLDQEDKINVSYTRMVSGGLKPSKKTKSMDQIKVIDGIVYGLVNVRTDGETILCATLNEGKSKWEIKKFSSRF
jgi:beta-lactamase superfamily II metal-dependent hydrolase